MISAAERVEVLDKKNFVAFLAVHQLIDEMLRQQNPITTGTQALGFSKKSVSNRIIRRVIESRMLNFFQREALARIP